MDIDWLKTEYRKKRNSIAERLKDFKRVYRKDDKDIFAELAYCICTAQAKAEEADRAIGALRTKGLLYKGSAGEIKPFLRYVRFWNKKAEYIVKARRAFTNGGRMRLKEAFEGLTPVQLRERLAENVLGLGYKEASHFLRNIGLGSELAILDRYILRCLSGLKVVRRIPSSLTRKKYLAIEEKMKRFSDRVGIPMDHMDLLLWSSQTGRIFK